MGSFSSKTLRATIVLGKEVPTFNEKDDNTLVLDGFRIIYSGIAGNGSPAPTAKIMIYGLSMTVINKLMRIKWKLGNKIDSFIQIEAKDGDNYYTVYAGAITFAYPDFAGAPDVAFIVESTTALQHKILWSAPISFDGAVDVATICKQLADNMRMKFENSGVSKKVESPYCYDSALNQVISICKASDVDLYLDINTLAISNKGQPRDIQAAVLSPTTGMIGYPVPTTTGCKVKCLYDPNIKFGAPIRIENSIIEMCNGTWRVAGVIATLESQVPNGRWLMELDCYQQSEKGEVHVSK